MPSPRIAFVADDIAPPFLATIDQRRSALRLTA
jgi:hypothetical protein